MLKRYLSGQAILSVTSNEQAWVPRRPDDSRDPGDMLPLLLRILRGAPGSLITLDHIFCADLALKRSIEKGSDTVAHLAQQRIAAIWQQLRDLGLGEVRRHGDKVHSHKYRVASLNPVAWIGFENTVFLFRILALEPAWTTRLFWAPGVRQTWSVNRRAGPGRLKTAEQRPSGKNRTRKAVPQWRDVGRIDLGSPLLSNKQLLQHLRGRPEWADVKVSCRTVWENKERILTEIRCVESETCPFR